VTAEMVDFPPVALTNCIHRPTPWRILEQYVLPTMCCFGG